MEFRVRANAPLWVPNKLDELSIRCAKMEDGIKVPSGHDADSFDLLRVQVACVFLLFTTISGFEIAPRNVDGHSTVVVLFHWNSKCIFPRNRRPLTLVVRFGGNLVLQYQGVLLH